MLPGDGLPARVCCICADKLESAYEFKLQVEQADTVLRERFVTMNMKEELFFNEVEVHLDAEERNEGIEEMHIENHYETTVESLETISGDEKASFLKDQLALLQEEKLTGEEQTISEQHDSSIMDVAITSEQMLDDCSNQDTENIKIVSVMSQNERMLKHEPNENCIESISTVEHDYILHQECILTNDSQETPQQQEDHHQQQEEQQQQQEEQQHQQQEEEEQQQLLSDESFSRDDCVEYVNLLVKATDTTHQEDGDENENKPEKSNETNTNVKVEQSSQCCQSETRRSKRKSVRRNIDPMRDSDEENYFENLNLSSRLKRTEVFDKSEKVFFMCYLCDKEFLSKNVLREHMHSHEEVRKALSLKKSLDKPEKSVCSIAKTPPSGKRSNKCPYCGKQYIYIISFSKHLKKHEKEKEEANEEPMPLEISFHEDEHSLDLEDYADKADMNTEYLEKGRRTDATSETRLEEEEQGLVEAEENEQEIGEEEEEKDGAEDYGEDEQRRETSRGGKERNDSLNESDERKKRDIRTDTFPCDKCLEKFSTRRGLRKHAVSHVVLRCSVCEEEFDSLVRLRNHRAKHVVEGVLSEQDLETDAEFLINKDTDGYDTGNKEGGEGNHEGGRRKEKEGEEEEGERDAEEMSRIENVSKRNIRNTETHSGIDFNCKVCCQRFSRMDLLQRHTEQHERVKSYKCTECNKMFGNELTLRNHLIATNHKTYIHGQEYDPNKRIKRVAAKAAQKIIDKIKTEDGLEDYDDEEEADDKVIDRHSTDGSYGRNKRETSSQKRHHGCKKELECVSCSKKCNSKQSLTKHMEQHVKEEKIVKSERQKQAGEKKERPRSCVNEGHELNAVNKYDDYDSDFESGLDWPMDNHECSKCKKRYSTKKSLLRHQLLHEEPNFECDICNVKFYRKDKLKAHYDKCSEKNPDQVRKCNICGDSFENNDILREHRSKHVTEGILTEEDLRDIEPRPEEKKIGEKIGRKRRPDIVGLECTECNKQYTSRKGLLRHIQVHEGKKYLCDICPKKFYRREHLKIHVAKHNMIKPYKCTRCTKRFIKEEQLTNHLSKHDRTFKKNKETDSSKRFLCEICSKSFTQSTTLIAHLRAHNGIKPYVCEVCSRPFTTNAYLKMHMRTHTQERPYICQYCSRAFARADTLANHLTSHTGEAKYHCKYCPKNFRRLKSLKEHVFIHTGQRPYACPTCDRRFNNNGSRYAHSKRCKQNFVQNQNRGQALTQVQSSQNQQRVLQQQTVLSQGQVLKSQNIKTITITRQTEPITGQQVTQHQEIIMPLIFPLTVTVADISEEVILPEGTKLFTTT
ncbi:Zinc finger protein 91 [Dufourea novaeangliae]|uniref:Zinc finger protein 91 n=2 Tax=Dufourea novaeangliae TaxID=178035 RepID=A0A154NZI1_DUFNO|nr:Zinc finger protein 91 [Dufourea novaeangliae]